MPLTANHLLLHYKQTISSLQHNFIFPHEENRVFLGFSMKTTRIRFIFGSNSSTEKILGSSVHGCRWLLLLQFFYWLPGNAIYDNTSNPVHAYWPVLSPLASGWKKNTHTHTFLVWVFFCCNLVFITEYFFQNKVTEQSGKKPTCL